jgi:hypothetical protein
MATTTQLLELDGISLRSEGVTFELLDANNARIGDIHPAEYPSIDHSATAEIKRRLSGFRLPPDEASDVNTLVHRVRPIWNLENGAALELGIFLFADESHPRRPWGVELEGTLFDQGLVLGQDLSTNVSFDIGTNIGDAIIALAVAAGITNVSIDATTTTLSSPLTFAAARGSTWAKAIDHLCAIAGFHPAYFTNAGALRARTAITDPSTVTPTLVYNGARIIASSITEANDLLQGPNRYIAVDTTATTQAVFAIYDLPDSAPHAVSKRRFAIPRHIEAPGVGTAEAALVVAQNAAAQDPKAFEEITFDATPDPRHESFDVIGYDPESTGVVVNYLELEWSLTLGPGGPMRHKIRRVYL